MNILETEWWNLALPPEWWAESEEDSILIGDRDGVGRPCGLDEEGEAERFDGQHHRGQQADDRRRGGEGATQEGEGCDAAEAAFVGDQGQCMTLNPRRLCTTSIRDFVRISCLRKTISISCGTIRLC